MFVGLFTCCPHVFPLKVLSICFDMTLLCGDRLFTAYLILSYWLASRLCACQSCACWRSIDRLTGTSHSRACPTWLAKSIVHQWLGHLALVMGVSWHQHDILLLKLTSRQARRYLATVASLENFFNGKSSDGICIVLLYDCTVFRPNNIASAQWNIMLLSLCSKPESALCLRAR